MKVRRYLRDMYVGKMCVAYGQYINNENYKLKREHSHVYYVVPQIETRY